jgi:hypothetical protein
MKEVKIVQIDSRGRIVIPLIVRKSLGITTDSQLMLIADSETKEMKITPIGLVHEQNYIKMRITMEDVPGALAKIATTFGDLGLNLRYGEAVIVEKDKKAIWTVISQSPNFDLEQLKEQLLKKGLALNIEFLPLE